MSLTCPAPQGNVLRAPRPFGALIAVKDCAAASRSPNNCPQCTAGTSADSPPSSTRSGAGPEIPARAKSSVRRLLA